MGKLLYPGLDTLDPDKFRVCCSHINLKMIDGGNLQKLYWSLCATQGRCHSVCLGIEDRKILRANSQ